MRYALLCAVLALMGCTTAPLLSVPESLLAPCEAPTVDASSNAGLTRGLRAYDAALRGCNDDKAAITFHLKEKL